MFEEGKSKVTVSDWQFRFTYRDIQPCQDLATSKQGRDRASNSHDRMNGRQIKQTLQPIPKSATGDTMSNSFWASTIQWISAALLIPIILRWLMTGQMKERTAEESRLLRLPTAVLIIGLTCFLGFSAVAIASNIFSNKTTPVWTTVTFLSFALLGLYLVAGYFIERHKLSEQGLIFGRVFRKQGYLSWSEVCSVRYSRNMNYFRLETHMGSVVRISTLFMGLPEFAKLVLANVPLETIEPGTFPILEAIANYSPVQ
ncbi:hypothetical protein J3D54_005698 [Pseudomonas sp. GGS8]|nr:hypothetical protein [Pseudomonas sp. GGS8]